MKDAIALVIIAIGLWWGLVILPYYFLEKLI